MIIQRLFRDLVLWNPHVQVTVDPERFNASWCVSEYVAGGRARLVSAGALLWIMIATVELGRMFDGRAATTCGR